MALSWEMPMGQGEAARRSSQCALALLVVFLVFAEFLPSEPFLNDFLLSKGISKDQLVDEVFAIYFYCHPAALVVMGVTAEYLGSAKTLLVGAVFGSITVCVTCFCSALLMIKLTQFTVVISQAAHAGAFWALLFDLSSKTGSHCQVHIHLAKAALLLSNFAAGVVGSILRKAFVTTYVRIWDVSLFGQLASVLTSAMLVWRVGMLQAGFCPQTLTEGRLSCSLWVDVLRNFRLRGVLEWTIWSIAMHAAHAMALTLWQSLLTAKSNEPHDTNGFVTAASYLLGVLVLLILARTPMLSDRGNRWWMIDASLFLSGALLWWMGEASGVVGVYSAFIMFQLVFRVVQAVALQQVGVVVREAAQAAESSRICASQNRARMALFFSITELLSSCVQAAVQYAFKHVHTANGKRLPLAMRFEMLGACLCGLAAILMATKLVSTTRRILR